MRSTVVIAGGRSTRFDDGDKAVAELAGTPMIRRVADTLIDVGDELVINCRSAQTPAIKDAMAGYPLSVQYAEDETPDRGPIAGIRNGLTAADGEFAFVVACDMPFLDPAVPEYLFERAVGHDAAVPRLGEWFQTTQAVYRVSAMRQACIAALDGDDLRILAALDELDYVVVTEDELKDVASVESFENINTVEEFEQAQNRLSTE